MNKLKKSAYFNKYVHKKTFTQKMFRKLGLAVFPHKKGYVYCPFELIKGEGKRLEAKNVEGFGELAKSVLKQKRTYLNYDRLYVLYQAMWNVRDLVAQAASIAEVGVYRGGGTYFLALSADRLFKTKPRIYAFDTFEGHHSDDISPEFDGNHRPGLFSETSYAEVKRYLSPFKNVMLYKGRFQDRCSEIKKEKFCMAHIDVDIYKATRDCLNFFSDRLLIGGFMIVDDYGFKTCEGAKVAVDQFVSMNSNFIKFHFETSQCALIRMC